MKYEGFDVITINGTLESTRGLKPTKVSAADKSYRLDKTRIFKYDEQLKKHVYGCYNEIVNLAYGTTSQLIYSLPLTTNGTISLRFKKEESRAQINKIISVSFSY